MFKEQKGITLVALVITIIVLLILAGVSISLVVGQNGVLGKATDSVAAQKLGAAKEAVGMALNSLSTGYYADWSTDQSTTRAKYYSWKRFAQEMNGYTVHQTEIDAAVTGADADAADAGEIATGTAIEFYLKSGKDVIKVNMTVTANGDVSSQTYALKDANATSGWKTVDNI